MNFSRGQKLVQLALNQNKSNFRIQGNNITKVYDELSCHESDDFDSDLDLDDSVKDPIWKPKRKELEDTDSDSSTDLNGNRKQKIKRRKLADSRTCSEEIQSNKCRKTENIRIKEIYRQEIVKKRKQSDLVFENEERDSEQLNDDGNEKLNDDDNVQQNDDDNVLQNDDDNVLQNDDDNEPQNVENQEANNEIEVQENVDNVLQLDEDEELERAPKKKKKRNPNEWEKNKNRKLRMHGKSYKGMKKNLEGHYKYSAERGERILKNPKCTKRCKNCADFTSEERKAIFDQFWENMDWNQKKVYVISLINKTEVRQRKQNEQSRRNQTLVYYLKKDDGQKVKVCKSMFLLTLGIGQRSVYDWVNASNNGIPSKPKQRNTSLRMPEKTTEAETFLGNLPKMPSHYCRSSSSKQYLEPTFHSFSELYTEYSKNCESSPLSRRSFTDVFHRLKLSLFQPKKDQCDICCGYETQNVTEDVYENHIKMKNVARDEKTRDKERLSDDTNLSVITLDLQAVLLSPMLKASAMYYKTKLACHNFTVFDLKSKDVSCYFWHECEGDLQASCFASCVVDYIMKLNDEITEVIIYSDGCTYQNRNAILANALLRVAFKRKITIVQKILEKGHTQMECDSVHSVVERKIANRPIYSPQSYVDIMKSVRPSQPYTVHYLKHDFFDDYTALKYYSSIRPGCRTGEPVVTDLRVLKYLPNGTILFKLHHDDIEFNEFPRRAKVASPSDDDVVNKLFNAQLPIKATKWNHLQELKNVIPVDFHPFYDSLPH